MRIWNPSAQKPRERTGTGKSNFPVVSPSPLCLLYHRYIKITRIFSAVLAFPFNNKQQLYVQNCSHSCSRWDTWTARHCQLSMGTPNFTARFSDRCPVCLNLFFSRNKLQNRHSICSYCYLMLNNYFLTTLIRSRIWFPPTISSTIAIA